MAYLGEIRIFACNFAPKGWALCNGQFLPINQNQALFSILGTTYGGNGQTTFALPDMRGRAPRGANATTYLPGQRSDTVVSPQSKQYLSTVTGARGLGIAPVTEPAATGPDSYGLCPPGLALQFCIALQGIFPGQT